MIEQVHAVGQFREPSSGYTPTFADELPRVLAILARVVDAQSVVLTMHPTGSAEPRIVAAAPASTTPSETRHVARLAHHYVCAANAEKPHWQRGKGARDAYLLVLLDEVEGHSRLVLCFHFAELTEERRIRADSYVGRRPLADGYFDLWQLSQRRERRCSPLEAALNCTDDGVVFVNRTSDILFANEAAEAVLASGRDLRRARGRLRATHSGHTTKLQMILELAIAASYSSDVGGDGFGGRILALPRRSEPPLMLLVLPSKTAPVEPTDVAAVLYLTDPRLDPGRMLHPICQVYGLSPGETVLAGHLAAGRALAVAAALMRIKEQTARGYLKSIFIKTSTNRQAEMVALLLGSLVRVKESVLRNAGFRAEPRMAGLSI